MTRRPVAIITGASKGMGEATARHLAAQGWDLVLGSRQPEATAAAIAAETGARIRAVPGDLAEPATTDRLIAAARDLGRLDGLLLNHGGPPVRPFMEIGEEDWARWFAVMVQGPLRLLRAAVPLFREAGGGRVVAISSFTVKSPHPGIGLSNALRAALVNAIKTAAQELGPDNILLNAIAPGYVATSRIEEWNRSYAAERNISVEEVAAEANSRVPLRRPGDPADFARLAGFLLSDQNNYVTGQQILFDGGMVVAN